MIVNYMTASSSSKRPVNPPSKTLFIGNLAFEMTDADLNKLFREVRNVIDVRVAIDRRTGQPRGFAHADFVDVKSAVAAMEQLQGREVYARPLRVDYSASTTRGAFPSRSQGNAGDRGGEQSEPSF
jgi:nucleolin